MSRAGFGRGVEVEEALQLRAHARERCASTSSIVSSVRSWLLPLGIADEPGAAADQRDRRVAGPLQARQRHDREQRADVQARRPSGRSRHRRSRARARTSSRARRWCRTACPRHSNSSTMLSRIHGIDPPLRPNGCLSAQHSCRIRPRRALEWHRHPPAERFNYTALDGLSRRHALKALVASGVGLGTGTLAYGMAYERHDLSCVDATLPVTGLPVALDGLRIGLITDMHHSEIVPAADVSRAVALLQDGRPELIVLGGDYVSFGDRRYVEPVAELLAPLAERPMGRSPCSAITTTIARCRRRSAPAGLHGPARSAHQAGDQRARRSISPVSVSGRAARRPRRASSATRVGRRSCSRTIRDACAEAAAFDVQLVLSGHTHGGQVLLPGVGAIAGRKFPVLAGNRTAKAMRRCSSAAASAPCTCRSASTARPKSSLLTLQMRRVRAAMVAGQSVPGTSRSS